MAVRSVTQWQIKPGRREEFLAAMSEAGKLHRRLGSEPRAFVNTFGGPNTGRVVYVLEYEDLAAFGTYAQKMQADPDWQQFIATRINGPEASATMVANSLLIEVPGHSTTGITNASRPGSVGIVVTLRVTPGHLPQTLEQTHEARRLIEGAGGRVRLWQAAFAGPNAGSLLAIVELDNLAALDGYRQKLIAGGDWQRFGDRVGSDGHHEAVSQSLVMELPTG